MGDELCETYEVEMYRDFGRHKFLEKSKKETFHLTLNFITV